MILIDIIIQNLLILIYMGIVAGCPEGCFIWFKGYNQKLTKLRQQYRTHHKNSIFFQLCINFVQQMHTLNQNGHGIKDQQENSNRGSLIDSTHYEQTLITDNNKKNKLPTRITSLTGYEKKQLVSDLIKRSYILLDISDIFKEEENKSYQSHIKHKIFQNDSEISDSFMDRRDNLVEALRKFNTTTIFKLENYIELSEKIKKSFDTDSDSLLSKFLISLKAKLIQNYNEDLNIDKLLKNTGIAIQILQLTVIIFYGITLQNDNQHQGEMGQNIQSSFYTVQEERMVTFLNQTNFYTLISSILFDDPRFHEFLQKVISEKFKSQLFKYKQLSHMTDAGFVAHILGKKSIENYFQPNITNLWNKKSEQEIFFQKTTKMFAKLPNKLPPILKLKILYQVEKQFLKEMTQLCNLKGVQMVYDRQKSQLMATWLMNRDKSIGQKNISSIILAYAFVHTAYRLGSKGSSVLSFIQNVQNILSWSIPDV